MKHRTTPQEKTVTHIYVRDAQAGCLRPCWASAHEIYCGVCMQGFVQAEIGSKCQTCSSKVEQILQSDRGGVPDLSRRHILALRKKLA